MQDKIVDFPEQTGVNSTEAGESGSPLCLLEKEKVDPENGVMIGMHLARHENLQASSPKSSRISIK